MSKQLDLFLSAIEVPVADERSLPAPTAPEIPLPDIDDVELDLAGPGLNTKFVYLYRDADNYKKANEVVLQGRLSRADIVKIFGAAWDGNRFIPSDVGMRDLQPLFGNGWELDADHPWHEIYQIAYLDEKPTSHKSRGVITAAALVAKWPASDDDWDFIGAEDRLIAAMGLSKGSKKKYGRTD